MHVSECGQFRPRMASSCVNDCPTCSSALQTSIHTIIYDYSSYSSVTYLLVAPPTNRSILQAHRTLDGLRQVCKRSFVLFEVAANVPLH